MASAAAPAPLAPFQPVKLWRRLLALMIDGAALAAPLALLTAAVGIEAIAAYPWQGHAAGAALAFVYFGVMGSALAGGRSLGKRVMKIAVVGLDGAPLALGPAFARAACLTLPIMLNGALVPGVGGALWWLWLQGVIVFGGYLALGLSILGDRAARRGFHDWVAGSVVVPSAGEVALPPPEPPKRLKLVVGVVAGLVVPAALAVTTFTQAPALAPMLAAQQALMQLPGVQSASVMAGADIGADRGGYVQLVLQVPTLPTETEADAREAIRTALAAAPTLGDADRYVVVFVQKADLGVYVTQRTAQASIGAAELKAAPND